MDGRRICCEGVEGFERAELDDLEVVDDGSAGRGEGTVKSPDMLVGRLYYRGDAKGLAQKNEGNDVGDQQVALLNPSYPGSSFLFLTNPQPKSPFV